MFGGNTSGSGDFPGTGLIEFVDGFSPGNSPGTVRFGGDVMFAATSATQIELGETSDQLLVDGNAFLDGELNVELLGDFTPDHGDQFPVITTGTRDGEFDTIDGIQVAADLTLAPINDYADHIGLTLIAAAPGDANFDGLVDVADLGILDANWTASQTTGNASALVPEPATLSLVAMSFLVVRRRQR